jgi:hypothetical protein
VQRRDLQLLVLGLRPREPRSLTMHVPPFCAPSRPVLEVFNVTLHRTDELIFPSFPRDDAFSSELVDTLLGQIEEVGERRGGEVVRLQNRKIDIMVLALGQFRGRLTRGWAAAWKDPPRFSLMSKGMPSMAGSTVTLASIGVRVLVGIGVALRTVRPRRL